MLQYLSLFSGIGAFEKALENCGVAYNLVGFSEIDKYAIQSYCAIHNVSSNKNFNDITKLDVEKLPKNIDLLTHGSPCQSFSKAGKGAGGDKGSGTRSSLMWYSVEVIERTLPKVVIWENVANVLSAKHIHNFEQYTSRLTELGYTSTYAVLNSKDFGVAQDRRRLICVSLLNGSFDFSDLVTQNCSVLLKDILEYSVSSKYFLNRPMVEESKSNGSGVLNVGQVSSKNSQGGKVYSSEGLFPTVCAGTHGYALGYIYDKNKVRQLTPLEVWKLMGFSTEDFQKCRNLGTSDTQLYKQAGNSIVVPMLESIFKELVKNK